VGQRWTLLVVRELLLRGPLPAAGIARGLPDIPMTQLVQRLSELEALGLVSVDRDTRAYELAEAGRDLAPVLESLAAFGLLHLAGERSPGEQVLPHVLMRQLELRFDQGAAAQAGFRGRFELVLSDPESLWSVEPAVSAPGRWALIARPDGLRARAGTCLEPDATLRLSVQACTRLVAGAPGAAAGVEVSGDCARAAALLELLGVPAAPAAAAA
jgi:DNA-binding HxlR family transcriptional regulator